MGLFIFIYVGKRPIQLLPYSKLLQAWLDTISTPASEGYDSAADSICFDFTVHILLYIIILVIIWRACICQSAQLTLIGNKFMFFQHGHLLHTSVEVPDPCFGLDPDQRTYNIS